MKTTDLRQKLLDEISKIPDNLISEIYELIHYYRIGIESETDRKGEILKLAGSWKGMPENDFEHFLENIKERRKHFLKIERASTELRSGEIK